jgi:acyl carrier protein
MESQYIKQNLKKILKKHFLIDFYFLNNDLYLEDIGIGQFDKLELVSYLESTFHIDLEDEEVYSLRTIGDILLCVKNHLNYSTAVAS